MDKYINQSLKQVCAEIEDELRLQDDLWEQELEMQELDEALGFNTVKQDPCICGNPECGGKA